MKEEPKRGSLFGYLYCHIDRLTYMQQHKWDRRVLLQQVVSISLHVCLHLHRLPITKYNFLSFRREIRGYCTQDKTEKIGFFDQRPHGTSTQQCTIQDGQKTLLHLIRTVVSYILTIHIHISTYPIPNKCLTYLPTYIVTIYNFYLLTCLWCLPSLPR
jgi:hypothetical protein